MKGERQDTKIKNHNSFGKKLKHISSGKLVRRIKDKLISNNEKQCVVEQQEQEQEKLGLSSIRHLEGGITPPETRADCLNGSTHTPILWSNDGVLRQALLSFTHPAHDEKIENNGVSKRNDSILKPQTIIINDFKLTSPISISSKNVQGLRSSKDPSHSTLSSKSVYSASFETLPIISIPPVSLTSGTFSHGALSLLPLSSGPLPPVSEIPRPGNVSSLNISPGSTQNSSELSDLGVANSASTSFTGSSSDSSAYEVPHMSSHALKVLVSLPTVSSSICVSSAAPVFTQTSSPSKDNSVTLVYSSLPKIESALLSSQKMLPLPPMSEMKSDSTNHLQPLKNKKVDAACNTTNSTTIIISDSDDSISEIVPVSTESISELVSVSSEGLSLTRNGSHASISLLATHLSNTSGRSTRSGSFKLNGNTVSATVLDHGDSLPSIISHPINFESNSNSSSDLNHIIIPVPTAIASNKDDHHPLTTQEINQIITIPLASGTLNGHSVDISVPLSMPVSCNGMLPVSCNLLPASSALQVTSMQPVSNSSGSLPENSSPIHSYPCTTIPPIRTSSLETGVVRTSQQHSRRNADASGLITVTSSMIPSNSSVINMAPVTSVSTSGIMGSIPVTSSSESVPVTSASASVPSSITTTSTTMVLATQNPSVEPVTAYTVQSPAEILSQLSKAGVLPTMSSSQVSSVLSALASDACHLDLETDNSHHVELHTQQQLQLMNLSSSVDKVSTLTQTDDLDVENTVEMGCNMNITSHGKVNSISGEVPLPGGSRLIEHHLQLLNNTSNVLSSLTLTNKPQLVNDILSDANSSASNRPINMVIENQVDVIGSTNAAKRVPSVYPVTSKRNSGPTVSRSLTRSDLTPKIDLQKQIIETMGRTSSSDSLNNNRTPSLYIKKEDFGNSINQKIIRSMCGNANVTKKSLQPNISSEIANMDMDQDEQEVIESEVVCYKCLYCPFLTLKSRAIDFHIQTLHDSLSGIQRDQRPLIHCPGCKNIFYTSQTLRLHLAQDHLVGSEELKVLVDLALKNNSIKNKVEKRKEKNEFRSNLGSCNSVEVQNTGNTVQSSNSCAVEISENSTPDVCVDECNKIRVRNLHHEAIPELTESLPSVQVLEDTNTNTTEEVRDGALVIDDPFLQQKRNCEYKLIKTDAETGTKQGSITEELDCVEDNNIKEQKRQKRERKSDQSQPPNVKKKRGRPKGSKNIPAEGYENISSDQPSVDNETGYRCDIDGCAVRFRSHDNIEYHRRSHSGNKFTCPECSIETAHWNSLSTHLWRYHAIDMELFSCDICSYKTNSLAKLMNLHRRIHGDERPFLCDICGKGFKNPKQMRNHKAIHLAKQKSTKGECDVCGRTFTSVRMLRVHKDNVHGKLRPHLCNYCGYSASSRSTLKMHMRQHTGEKPFHCDECEYETADHNSLRRHKMRHSGDKPYKCPICPYACIQSSTYKAHLSTKHLGMESGLMFSCNMCSFRSVRKDNYLAHVAEHEAGTTPNNRRRKHATPKSQINACKKEQERDIPQRQEKTRLPVIINFSDVVQSTEQSSLSNDNVETAGSVQLIYSGSSVDGLLQESSENVENERFGVEVSSDSVINLVEELDTNNISAESRTSSVQTLCVANIETVTEMPLTPEYEAEEITGDIVEIKEPQEIKFKVVDDISS